MRPLQHFRDIAFDDAPRQTFGNSGLAHTRFANQERIVLAAPAQGLHHTLKLALASNQRINLARQRHGIQVHRKVFQCTAGTRFLLGFHVAFRLVRRGALRHFGDAMGNVIHHIKSGNAFLMQEVHRVRILFA